ncbi:hypothetical protein SCP_1304120 [Sparassis crispa]|uniref:Retrotransposon gag domain-containing protein n=1 Tax=Sparassis crispa TaxID=139825 RepID=A0A401H2E9_9APHY|nr:hypothetical protein SCP_1304120 [Sparassis crispa]GBE88594.1 hypothetical protein SCP_1304120 [Sparassis crispa]
MRSRSRLSHAPPRTPEDAPPCVIETIFPHCLSPLTPLSKLTESIPNQLANALADNHTTLSSPMSASLGPKPKPSPHSTSPPLPAHASRTHLPTSSSSGSSSNAYDPAYSHFPTTMDCTCPTIATVLHPSLKQAPILTPSKLTPAILLKWEAGCLQYFKKKNIANTDHVTKVTGSLQDELIQDWYLSNADEIEAMRWPNFLATMHSRWLEKNWEDKMLTELIRMRQRDDDCFEHWVVNLQKQNALLRRSSLHMEDDSLHTQITANACKEVCITCNKLALKNICNFKE